MPSGPMPGQMSIDEVLALREWCGAAAAAPVLLPLLVVAAAPVAPVPVPNLSLRTPDS